MSPTPPRSSAPQPAPVPRLSPTEQRNPASAGLDELDTLGVLRVLNAEDHAVIEAVASLRPRAVVYVACDPAALARDVATARGVGLEVEALRVLDAFPMTHHMECIALLRPGH